MKKSTCLFCNRPANHGLMCGGHAARETIAGLMLSFLNSNRDVQNLHKLIHNEGIHSFEALRQYAEPRGANELRDLAARCKRACLDFNISDQFLYFKDKLSKIRFESRPQSLFVNVPDKQETFDEAV